MISFHSVHVIPKQDYLHSIHFHSFPFLYFKTSNQGYLILFHSFPLLKYIPFHSIPFHSLMIILFHSLMNSQTEPQGFRLSQISPSNYIHSIFSIKVLFDSIPKLNQPCDSFFPYSIHMKQFSII